MYVQGDSDVLIAGMLCQGAYGQVVFAAREGVRHPHWCRNEESDQVSSCPMMISAPSGR